MKLRSHKVLVYRTGHMGDTICATPAFRLLRGFYRDSHLTLLCDQPSQGKVPAVQVVGKFDIFDAIVTYRSGLGLVTMLDLARTVKKIKPNIVIMLPQFRETKKGLGRKIRFFRLCSVRDVRGLCFTTLNHLWQPNEAERLIKLLFEMGIKGDKPGYDIPINPLARASVIAKLAAARVDVNKPLLVFCGGGKAPTQHWELERYAQVLAAVESSLQLSVVGLGNQSELARYKTCIAPHFPGLRLLDQLDLSEMFELFRLATAYFGNDTGPMHAAAALGCPVAAVISARNPPGSWDPDVEPRLIFRHRTECENCFLVECSLESHRCMSSITPAQVIAGLEPFLANLLSLGSNQASVFQRGQLTTVQARRKGGVDHN